MYIGVTGFTERWQLLGTLPHVPTEVDRLFMVGVLATQKSLLGLPGGNSKRNPKVEDIASIFPVDWRTLNLLHYCTRDQTNLFEQFVGALGWAGGRCDGIQMNIVWPDPTAVLRLRKRAPKLSIVLQINRGAMAAHKGDAEAVAEHASEVYGDIVDYIHVDASGGKGIPLVPTDACAYLIELANQREKRRQKYQLVVAGGIDADNIVELLTPIRMLVPEVGVNVEGRVRTDDLLDPTKVAHYIAKAYSFMTLPRP